VRSIAALVVSAGLVFGLAPVAGAVTGPTAAADSGTVADARCAQLRKRLAGAPATLRRVDANLAELRARLADVRLPARRALLEERIQRLEQLRTALAERIADARAACATVT
jgi:uncharacterized protein YhaN